MTLPPVPDREHVSATSPSAVPLGLALLGEAPGAEEAVARTAFVGPAGKVLNQLLRAAGIDRAACWVGNVFPARLNADDILSVCAGARERKTWGPGYALPPVSKGQWLRPELVPHVEAIRAELAALAPRVIVPLGGTALWALTGHAGIGDFRGTLIRQTPAGPWILPTYHPAAVGRVWKLFATTARDLGRAAAIARDRTPELVAPEVLVAERVEQIGQFHAECAAGRTLAVDIETMRGQIDTVSVGTAARVLVVPFVDAAAPSRSWWPSTEVELMALGALRTLLEDGALPKVLQNGLYDLYWLERLWGIRVANARDDTKLAAHALYPELPKSLAYLGSTYADVAPWKHLGKWRADEETAKD